MDRATILARAAAFDADWKEDQHKRGQPGNHVKMTLLKSEGDAAKDAEPEWKEDQHKRDDNGKFSSGGGGGGASPEASKSAAKSELSKASTLKNKAMHKIATAAGYKESGPLEWTHPETGAKINAKPGGYFTAAGPSGTTHGKSAGFLAEVLKQPGFQKVVKENKETSFKEAAASALKNAGWQKNTSYHSQTDEVWTKDGLTVNLQDNMWGIYNSQDSKINGGGHISSLSKTLSDMQVGGEAAADPKSDITHHPDPAVHKELTDAGFKQWVGNTGSNFGSANYLYTKSVGDYANTNNGEATEIYINKDKSWQYYLPKQTTPITGEGMSSLKKTIAGTNNSSVISAPQGYGKHITEVKTQGIWFPGHGVDVNAKLYKMDTGEQIGISETTGAWIIWPEYDLQKSGEGQASLNAAFEAMHPRDASGKFVAGAGDKPTSGDRYTIANELTKYGFSITGVLNVSPDKPAGEGLKFENNNDDIIEVYEDGSFLYNGESSTTSDSYAELLGLVQQNHPNDGVAAGKTAANHPDTEHLSGASAPAPAVVQPNDHPFGVVNQKLDGLGYTKMGVGDKWYITKGPNGEMLAVGVGTNGNGDFEWQFTPYPKSESAAGYSAGSSLVNMNSAVLDGAATTSQGATKQIETAPIKYTNELKSYGFEPSGEPGIWTNGTGGIITIKTGGHWIVNFSGSTGFFTSGQGLEAFQKGLGDALASGVKPQVNIGNPVMLSDLTKVGEKLGSNEGGSYTDEGGDKYYVKMGKTPDHARNELLAAALAQSVGLSTLQYRPVVDGDKMGTATKWQEKQIDNLSGLNSKQKEIAQRDFAVQVWLANWDAVGLTGDNVGVVNDKVTCLDFGGSLLYRAQGSPKGSAFNGDAVEWDTLRDKHKNAKAAQLYGSMTNQQLAQSAARLTQIDDDTIRQLTLASGPGNLGEREKLAETLIKRRDAIIKKGEEAGKQQDKTPAPAQVVSTEQEGSASYPKPKQMSNSSWDAQYHERIAASPKPGNGKEASAVTKYSGGAYDAWNKALRGSFGEESGGYPTKDLMAYLSRASWSEEGSTVTRKVSGAFAKYLIDEADGGHVFVDHGFASSDHWSGSLTMKIGLPKGAQAAAIGHYSQHPGEREILIQAGSKYRIDSYDPKTNTMNATLIRSGPTKGGIVHESPWDKKS